MFRFVETTATAVRELTLFMVRFEAVLCGVVLESYCVGPRYNVQGLFSFTQTVCVCVESSYRK